VMAQPEVWSDLHQDLRHDSRGAVKKVINVDSVLTSVDNILGTRQGERVMLPEFASALGNMLFEPIDRDLLGFIGDEVKRVIETWDDRVSVSSVNFFTDPDRSYVEMNIGLRIKGYDQVFEYRKKIGGS
jgi:phage baseplate assembly protein W